MKMAAAEALYETQDGGALLALRGGAVRGHPGAADREHRGAEGALDHGHQQPERDGRGHQRRPSRLPGALRAGRLPARDRRHLLDVQADGRRRDPDDPALGGGAAGSCAGARSTPSRRFLTLALWAIPLPFLANAFGWIFTEMGRQPWVVQGLLRTSDASSPAVSTARGRRRPSIGFTLLYGVLAGVAGWLAVREIREGHGRRGARRGERRRRAARAARPRARVLGRGETVDPSALETLWFVLIAVLWIGYLVPRGLRLRRGDAASGPRPRRRPARVRSSAPSGPSGTATRSGCWSPAAPPSPRSRSGTRPSSPASTWRSSSSCVALIVRGVAFEFRGQARRPALARAPGTRPSSSAASCRRCSGAWPSPTWCAACPSTPTASSSARFWDLLNPYALLGGLATLLLCLAHGAVFLVAADRRRGARAGALASPARSRPRSSWPAAASSPGRSRARPATTTWSPLALVAGVGTALAAVAVTPAAAARARRLGVRGLRRRRARPGRRCCSRASGPTS